MTYDCRLKTYDLRLDRLLLLDRLIRDRPALYHINYFQIFGLEVFVRTNGSDWRYSFTYLFAQKSGFCVRNLQFSCLRKDFYLPKQKDFEFSRRNLESIKAKLFASFDREQVTFTICF